MASIEKKGRKLRRFHSKGRNEEVKGRKRKEETRGMKVGLK